MDLSVFNPLAPEPTIMKKVTVEGTFSRLLRTAKP